MYAGIVDCKMGKNREETCIWRNHEVHWGYGASPDQMRVSKIHFSADMILQWNPRGGLSSWDVNGGDRKRMWSDGTNAQLRASFHKNNVEIRDGYLQELGKRLEESILKTTLGWLEVQWPKKETGKNTWQTPQPPRAPRFYRSGVTGGKLTTTVEADGRWIVEGKISETSTTRAVVSTMVTAVYAWEGNRMTGVMADSIHSATNAILTGHRRQLVQIYPVTPETDPRPNHEPVTLFK